jgi:diadenosine tetraphosphate (Ap4A) HIT family hydrolase
MASRTECPFCGFDDERLIVLKDDLVFAIVARDPINPYQMLVAPHVHYTSFIELPEDVACRVFLVAQKLSAAMRQVCRPGAISHESGDAILWSGFNVVEHYKFHIIPRYEDDRVRIDYRRLPDPGEQVRAAWAGEIRSAMSAGTDQRAM